MEIWQGNSEGDGWAVMGNWGFGADLWVVGLVHGHTLHFVANQLYLSKQVKALHVYSRGLL